MRLKCHKYHVIKISLAFYGELDPGQELCKDVSSVLEQCRKDVTQIVRSDCDNKQHCLFKIDQKRFKAYCQAIYYYLDVRHTCGKLEFALFTIGTPKYVR